MHMALIIINDTVTIYIHVYNYGNRRFSMYNYFSLIITWKCEILHLKYKLINVIYKYVDKIMFIVNDLSNTSAEVFLD